MRIEINGRKYRLKTSVLIRLQALALLALAAVSFKAGADGAAVFFAILGSVMLFGKIN